MSEAQIKQFSLTPSPIYAGTIHKSNTSHAWTIHQSNPDKLLVFKDPQVGSTSWVNKLDEQVGSTIQVHKLGPQVGFTRWTIKSTILVCKGQQFGWTSQVNKLGWYFQVWPLPEVENRFWKQIWNENVHILILNVFFGLFRSVFKKVKIWISHCIFKFSIAKGGFIFLEIDPYIFRVFGPILAI